jgi:hypothetical protein
MERIYKKLQKRNIWDRFTKYIQKDRPMKSKKNQLKKLN